MLLHAMKPIFMGAWVIC